MGGHQVVHEFGSGDEDQPRGHRQLDASFESRFESVKSQRYLKKKYPRSLVNPGSFESRKTYYGNIYEKSDSDENDSDEADSKLTSLQYRFAGVTRTSPGEEDLKEPNPFDDPTEDSINEKGEVSFKKP